MIAFNVSRNEKMSVYLDILASTDHFVDGPHDRQCAGSVRADAGLSMMTAARLASGIEADLDRLVRFAGWQHEAGRYLSLSHHRLPLALIHHSRIQNRYGSRTGRASHRPHLHSDGIRRGARTRGFPAPEVRLMGTQVGKTTTIGGFGT